MRTTIIVDANNAEDMRAAEAWLDRWRPALRHVSDDEGCGCCVHIWHVTGPAQAVDELPPSMRQLPGAGWTSNRMLIGAGLAGVAALLALVKALYSP